LSASSINAQALTIQANGSQSQGQIDLADLRFVYYPSMQPASVERITSLDLNTISLRFDEPMNPGMAASLANYLIAAATGNNDAAFSSTHPVAPSVATYYPSSHSVSLTTPKSMRAGGKYTVTVAPIKDSFGVATKQGYQTTAQVTSHPLTITVDPMANRHTLSPELYGISNIDFDQARELGVTGVRWGGENNSRYNWKLGNAWNAANDYQFENGNYDQTSYLDTQPSGVADQFIEGAHSHNMSALITIPMLGFVAKDSDPNSRSLGLPSRGAPPLKPNGDAIKGYARGRKRPSATPPISATRLWPRMSGFIT
jgi:Glycoside hydrolase family 44